MAHRKHRVLRIIGWIVLGFLSLILVVTLGFYLGRGWILNRAVTYLNEQQPGEVQMDQMNLIPFMNFPDISLQLRDVTYYEKEINQDSLLQEPILSLSEIYVTLDVIDLIRGDILVSQARIENGFLRFEIYEDSVSNFEYALGFRLGEKPKSDSKGELPALRVDMDRLEFTNVMLQMDDRTEDNHVKIIVNKLENQFSYLPDHVEAGIKLDVDINHLKYLTYRLEENKRIVFESEVTFDPVRKRVEINPSSVEISGLELETWGTYEFLEEPRMDLAFKARNEGLDVLNYLFRGILDLDEIEQIGSGTISLNGNVNGTLGDQLPVVRINGMAQDIGFRIKSIQKDVTDISFKIYGTNGTKLDNSEGLFQVEGFTATFPEGNINANVTARNMISPEVNIELNGNVNLAGLDQFLKTKVLSDLEGNIVINGDIEGVVDKNNEVFMNNTSSLRAMMTNVGFNVKQDSLNKDSIKDLNGELFITEKIIGTNNLSFEYNENRLEMGVYIENLLLYLLDFDRDVIAEISISSDALDPATFIRDTSITGLIGDELRGLHFNAGAMITKQELDAFIHDDSIPEVRLTLDSFNIEIPVYSDISNMNASLTFGPDTVTLHHLNGTIGDSEFSFAGLVSNYSALDGQDSSAVIDLEFQASSDLMRAEDFFTFDQEFLLPEIYQTEHLENFHLSGSMGVPIAGMLYDSTSLDFGLDIIDLGWNFRYYPLTLEQFLISLRRKENQLYIDNFQGKIGESNIKMTAHLGNFNDSLVENLYGSLVLESDLLDFNELLNYQLPEELQDTTLQDTTEIREPPRLDQIEYPQFDFTVDIGELRYGENKIFGMHGRVRSTRNKIFYLDRVVTSGESGGSIEFNGQFNVSNPQLYTFSAELDLKDMNINDLDFEMQSGEQTYTLKENFKGIVTASGLAEIFITPELKFDIPTTTAMFNVKVKDGELINFTPLQAVAKYLDNKDLNHVKFAALNNSFTLMDSKIFIPLMNVESNVGQLLIEGEQGLDKSFLYLLRLPTWLVKGAAKSRLSDAEDGLEEDQIYEMKMGTFMKMTAWGIGEESEVKLGDKRDKYQY